MSNIEIIDKYFYMNIFISSKNHLCHDFACSQVTGTGKCLLRSAMEREAQPHPCKITSMWITLLDCTYSRKSDASFAYPLTANNGRQQNLQRTEFTELLPEKTKEKLGRRIRGPLMREHYKNINWD